MPIQEKQQQEEQAEITSRYHKLGSLSGMRTQPAYERFTKTLPETASLQTRGLGENVGKNGVAAKDTQGEGEPSQNSVQIKEQMEERK